MASAASQLIEEVTAHAQSDSLEDAREICADGTYFPNNLRTPWCCSYLWPKYVDEEEYVIENIYKSVSVGRSYKYSDTDFGYTGAANDKGMCESWGKAGRTLCQSFNYDVIY